MILSFIGWICGIIQAIAFSICAMPLAYSCYKMQNADGISLPFLYLWGLGELTLMVYAIITLDVDIPILTQAVFNASSLLIILYFKFWGADANKEV